MYIRGSLETGLLHKFGVFSLLQHKVKRKFIWEFAWGICLSPVAGLPPSLHLLLPLFALATTTYLGTGTRTGFSSSLAWRPFRERHSDSFHLTPSPPYNKTCLHKRLLSSLHTFIIIVAKHAKAICSSGIKTGGSTSIVKREEPWHENCCHLRTPHCLPACVPSKPGQAFRQRSCVVEHTFYHHLARWAGRSVHMHGEEQGRNKHCSS